MSAPSVSEKPTLAEHHEPSTSELSERRLQDSRFHKHVLMIFSLLVAVTYGIASGLIEVYWPSYLFMRLFSHWMVAIVIGLLSIPMAAAVTAIQMKVYPALRLQFRGWTRVLLALLLSSFLVAPVFGLLILIGNAEVNHEVSSLAGVAGVPPHAAAEVASGGHNTKVGRSIVASFGCLVPAWVSMILIARHFDGRNGEAEIANVSRNKSVAYS